MAILVKPSNIHWNYFLALESDLVRLARFIEFAQDNFGTYSIEIARLIMTAAAEVDVVAKLVCKRIDPNSRARNINGYASLILRGNSPKLCTVGMLIPRYGITLQPWSSWTPTKPPLWWTAYNNVKHHRDTDFKDANLGNALNAVAGLFSLTIYHYALGFEYRSPAHGARENPLDSDHGRKLLLGRLQPQAQLFQLRGWAEDVAASLR